MHPSLIRRSGKMRSTGRGACVAALAASLAGCAVTPAAQETLRTPAPAVMARVAVPGAARSAERETGASEHLEGCFGGQMSDFPWGARAAAATVHIHEPDGLGDDSGTGFVVRNSGSDGGGDRIVTAGHVVDQILRHGGLLEIASSSGVRMGYAEVVERPRAGLGMSSDGRTLVTGDLAVVEMRGFFKDGRSAFAAIEGLDISRTLPRGPIEGMFSRPAGIVEGASGSPVIDADGRVVGVLVGSVTDAKDLDNDAMWSANVRLVASDAMWYDRWLSKPGDRRDITLPARSRSYAASLADLGVLSALGRPGAAARSQPLSSGDNGRVTVPGFPEQVCVAYRGDMHPIRVVR